jgi:hypothetical protein
MYLQNRINRILSILGIWLYYGSHESSTYSDLTFHNSRSKWDRVVPSNQKKSNGKIIENMKYVIMKILG